MKLWLEFTAMGPIDNTIGTEHARSYYLKLQMSATPYCVTRPQWFFVLIHRISIVCGDGCLSRFNNHVLSSEYNFVSTLFCHKNDIEYRERRSSHI